MLGDEFMRNAFIAGGGIALAAGLVGYFVVLRNQVFATDALGHVAFTGGLAGALAGIPLLPSVFVTSILGAVAIGSLGGRGRGRDVAIGTIFSWVLGLGVLFLSIYTTLRSARGGIVGVSVLFGSILTLEPDAARAAAIAGLLSSAVLLFVCRPLLFATLDPDVATARGVPVRQVTLVFLALVGATVAEAVQAVGALLIFGLMVTPAAIAQSATSRPYHGLALSALLSLLFVWTGVFMAYYLPYPPSFLVVAISSATYLAAATLRRLRATT
ncbi:MAG: metal ABC transporter permease [Candidatus Dormibacteria bacterium]